ncbi:MAG: hypothetical protein AAFV85_07470 [Cyanobacteria bacterium J06634_6]
MKFNLKTVAIGSLAALALLAAPLGLVKASHAEGGRGGQHLEQLDLSEAQRTQIEAIRTDTRSQIESVLTADQQATLENSEQRGRRAFRELDLSEDQREQLRAIHEDSRDQVSEVLTDEQRSQLEEMREQRGDRRGVRRENRLESRS